MTFTTLLIVALIAAPVFVGLIFISVRTEGSRLELLSMRAALLLGYTVGMLAVGWLIHWLIPPTIDWLEANIGFWPGVILTLGPIAAGGVWAWLQHRKHPEWSIDYRPPHDAGKFSDPRDP